MEKIKIEVLEGGTIPARKTDGAACVDCYARISNPLHETSIYIGRRRLIPLGFKLEMPEGYEAVIRPRSGNSSKGIDVCIGTIDSDYRGEVMACVINNSECNFTVKNGDRICQMAIRKIPDWRFEEGIVKENTERGSNGFGSTGIA